MQIILMRHGKPRIDGNLRLNAREFGLWVEKYNTSGIDMRYSPPQRAIDQADRCSITVCSNLPRSLESLKALGIDKVDMCDPQFREMEMPHAAWQLPRLPVGVWSAFFRFIWTMGYSENAESFKSSKKRARRCAQKLAELSLVHGDILFVGHGLLNCFIAKYLRNEGWACPETPIKRYWDSNTYCLQPK